MTCDYAMLDKADPWNVAEGITSGFASQCPLSDLEHDLLPQLIRWRLAMSVAISAHQQTLARDDVYLRISEAPRGARSNDSREAAHD